MPKTTFVNGNPAQGILGTVVTAEFLNAMNKHHHTGRDVDGEGALPYAADAGSADTYEITLNPALGAYIVGMPIYFKAGNANTGPSTLNVNGLGAKAIKKNVSAALEQGDIIANQLVTVIYDGTNFQLGSKQSALQIKGVSASVGSNALTVGCDPMVLDFRSATLTSGLPIRNIPVGSLSLTVPSGATLGTADAVQAQLALVVLYNGGSPALGIVNMAGGNNLSETTLLSTTAISDAADAKNVVYSQNAITNSPFRVVGYINITEETVGTWATAPTLVQGCGGQAMAAMQSLGFGQTWQNLTGSRAKNTTYYNTTERPIAVQITATYNAAVGITLKVNDIDLTQGTTLGSTTFGQGGFWIVPPGGTYLLVSNGLVSISRWIELR